MGIDGMGWRRQVARARRLLAPGLVLVAMAGAAFAEPLRPCGGCDPHVSGPCLLIYGSVGTVGDRVTGEPIAGATIVFLDLEGTSAADGSYRLEGSRAEQCHLDYFYSHRASAPGYKLVEYAGYATSTFGNLLIALEPDSDPRGYTVFGTVAQDAACSGVRGQGGVAVVLEPLGLATHTSIDAFLGGMFAFEHVPSGNYTVRVQDACGPCGVNGCPPFQTCWAPADLTVGEADVHVAICKQGVGTGPTPTPTICPMKTPCVMGEQPRPCADQPCGLGCGCEPCPPCGEGQIPVSRIHLCECVADPDYLTPTPTATPPPTVRPTSTMPPLCHGDCNNDGVIGISELVAAVNVALGGVAPTACQSFDRDGNGVVGIDELVTMVAAALNGCSAAPQ